MNNITRLNDVKINYRESLPSNFQDLLKDVWSDIDFVVSFNGEDSLLRFYSSAEISPDKIEARLVAEIWYYLEEDARLTRSSFPLSDNVVFRVGWKDGASFFYDARNFSRVISFIDPDQFFPKRIFGNAYPVECASAIKCIVDDLSYFVWLLKKRVENNGYKHGWAFYQMRDIYLPQCIQKYAPDFKAEGFIFCPENPLKTFGHWSDVEHPNIYKLTPFSSDV